MLNKDRLIRGYVRGKEAELVERYIVDGPAELKKSLGLTDDEWEVVFDHLVFEHNLLYKCATSATDFFLETYVDHGLTRIRDILEIMDTKYDQYVELIFDYVAIVNGGLYRHVLKHRDRYVVATKARGVDFVKKVLHLSKDKYQGHWSKILDLLLSSVNDGLAREDIMVNGLKSFSKMMNGMRSHRRIFGAGLFVS